MEPKQKPTGTPEEKQKITAPMAIAELEIIKLEATKSVADKVPEIRNIALLLAVVLGVAIFGQILSYVILTSFNNTQTNFFSVFVESNGVLDMTFLLIQAIAIFILLFTRKASHAKAIILLAGIGFGFSLVNSITNFDIGPAIMTNFATLAVNFLIFRKILKVYLAL